MKKTHTLKIAKVTKKEIQELSDFIQNLSEIIEENESFEESCEANKEIAKIAKKIPNRAFLIPINLSIMLDNYQDKESNILEHPKWLINTMNLLKEIDKHLKSNQKNQITPNSILHIKIKKILENYK